MNWWAALVISLAPVALLVACGERHHHAGQGAEAPSSEPGSAATPEQAVREFQQELSPPEGAYYEGIQVDLLFRGDGPGFGDLFTMVGHDHPSFPPEGRFDFAALVDLRFSQADDFFGIETSNAEDIAIWLYPLADGQAVYHHPGPFDGLRLQYNILRNSRQLAEHFLMVVDRMAHHLPVDVVYLTRNHLPLAPDDVVPWLRADIEAVTQYWVQQGIEPGSHEALVVDF